MKASCRAGKNLKRFSLVPREATRLFRKSRTRFVLGVGPRRRLLKRDRFSLWDGQWGFISFYICGCIKERLTYSFACAINFIVMCIISHSSKQLFPILSFPTFLLNISTGLYFSLLHNCIESIKGQLMWH